jgi:hypothetical protein
MGGRVVVKVVVEVLKTHPALLVFVAVVVAVAAMLLFALGNMGEAAAVKAKLQLNTRLPLVLLKP